MIAGLIGTVRRTSQDSVLLNVQGVIYRVLTSGRTIGDVEGRQDAVELYTHLVVREDAQLLFGFASEAELFWFETLIGVNGVGPRLACAVLTRLAPDALLEAVSGEQVDILSTVPGIGKRTASRIILDLRGKLPETEIVGGRVPTGGDSEVAAALQSLGYTPSETLLAIAESNTAEPTPVEERVLAALRRLGGS